MKRATVFALCVLFGAAVASASCELSSPQYFTPPGSQLIKDVRFSPGGGYLFVVLSNSAFILVYRYTGGTLSPSPVQFNVSCSYLYTIDFSPSGNYAIVGGSSCTVLLRWNEGSGVLTFASALGSFYGGHPARLWSDSAGFVLDISSMNKVAVNSTGFIILVASSKTDQYLTFVEDFAISESGNTITVAGGSSSFCGVVQFDVNLNFLRRAECPRLSTGLVSWLDDAVLSPGGRYFVSTYINSVVVFPLDSAGLVSGASKLYSGTVLHFSNGVAFHPTGNAFVTCNYFHDYVVVVQWDNEGGVPYCGTEYSVGITAPRVARFSPDGSAVVACSSDGPKFALFKMGLCEASVECPAGFNIASSPAGSMDAALHRFLY